MQDDLREFALLLTVEQREVTPQEALQALPTSANRFRADFRVRKQRLRRGVFEQRHPCRSKCWASLNLPRCVRIPSGVKRLQSN